MTKLIIDEKYCKDILPPNTRYERGYNKAIKWIYKNSQILTDEEIDILLLALEHSLNPKESGWIMASRQKYRDLIKKLKGEGK